MSKKVIIAVERGWQTSRQKAIELAKEGLHVDILIKGFVERDVLDMITRHPGMQVSAVSKALYRPVLFMKVFLTGISRNLDRVLVEGRQIERWLKVLCAIFSRSAFLLKP